MIKRSKLTIPEINIPEISMPEIEVSTVNTQAAVGLQSLSTPVNVPGQSKQQEPTAAPVTEEQAEAVERKAMGAPRKEHTQREYNNRATELGEPSQVSKDKVAAAGIFSENLMTKRYNTLKPKAQNFYKDFRSHYEKKYGEAPAIESAGRTQAEQNRIYAQGRSTPGKKVTWTRNSKHIGGYAIDLVSPRGSSKDPKGTLRIAKEMRTFAQANPGYGAKFLSISKDMSHVQFR